jgi:ATP-binding cassette, subfamily B, bacterial
MDKGGRTRASGRRVRPRPLWVAAEAVRFVWQAARREFGISLVAEGIGALGLAGVLLFGRQLVSELTGDPPAESLGDVLPATAGLAVSLLASGLATVFVRQMRWLLAERVTRRIQEEVIGVSTSVDYELYEQQRFHDQLSRSNARAAESSYQLAYDVLMLTNVVATSTAVIVVLVESVPEVLGALVVIALPLVLAARASARLAFRTTYELTPNDRLRSYLYRALTGKPEARELRVFGIAPMLRRRWDALYDERMGRLHGLLRRQVVFNGLASLCAALLVAAVLLMLVAAAIDGRIGLGDAAVAVVALQQLTTRVRSAASASGSLSESLLFLHDFDEFRRLRVDTGRRAPDAVLPGGPLVVDHVSFRYPGQDRLVLDDVSLELAPGEIVALVGVSGSGKTTLAHLAAGLYRPTVGRITFAGTDVASIPRDVYWRSVSAVFQDFVRYELTARENVAISDHVRAGEAASVAAAAQRAGIDGVLDGLTDGYETMLSRAYDGGADLSVGQWQRVAVARAFFREAPVLILDEPAAALDAVEEQRLYERLVELCRSRTVLLISHRFSTVRMADRICVMHDGRITEAGTHGELMALRGRYHELFSLQAQGYLADGRDSVDVARANGAGRVDGERTDAAGRVVRAGRVDGARAEGRRA